MPETKRLVLVLSGPAAGALSAVETAQRMREQGHGVDLCLLQDGVLCALQGNETSAGGAVGRALGAGVGVFYMEDDLAARGFDREDARPEARALSYENLVDLMLDGERTTLGAF